MYIQLIALQQLFQFISFTPLAFLKLKVNRSAMLIAASESFWFLLQKVTTWFEMQ